MQPAVFQRFARLAYDKAGIAIKPEKVALVNARVAKRLRALCLDSPESYIDYLEKDQTGEELTRFLDLISTHFTSFFREPDHFDLLEEEGRRWASEGRKRVRIWSAACSTGEEPYSMAMTLLDVPGLAGVDWRILATDIAVGTLDEARAGRYAAGRVENVPPPKRKRYLTAGAGAAHCEVASPVRERVFFQRLNLAAPPFPMRGPLDVVFCRNVLIYFDQATRGRLVLEIERLLAPGGLFCIGHTETLNGVRSRFRMVRPSVFRKDEGGGAR
ncbi:MAG TPA: CheR family methyltransferase [Anaeromyxobacteraceae bacterium]|nr:CheR family methyltransferase [Anaeromyxobacteraceae bacterium]